MVRWAVPAAANVLCRQINAHLRNASRAHVRTYARIRACTTLATTDSNRRYLCYCINPLPPFGYAPHLSRRRHRRRHPRVVSSARSNPIIRVLRFVRSNSVCLIIRTVRLFPTRAAVCFNTALLVRVHTGNCERYARFVSLIGDWRNR